MDPQYALHHPADQRVSIPEIGEGRRHTPKPAEQPGVAQHPIAERSAFLLGALVLRSPDVFLDRHLRGAGDFAKLATGAKIEPRGDRGLRL